MSICLGHALHQEGLHRQKGVVPLVSNQERRALMAPVINRLATGRQPFVLLHSIYIGCRLSVLPKILPGGLSSVHWGANVRCSLGRTDLPPSHPAPPHLAPLRPQAPPPCAAPPRPARGMSGFWIRQVIKPMINRTPGTWPAIHQPLVSRFTSGNLGAHF